MNVNKSIELKDGAYQLQVSFSGKLYGSTVAMAIMVKGTTEQDVIDRAKVLVTELKELGLETINELK